MNHVRRRNDEEITLGARRPCVDFFRDVADAAPVDYLDTHVYPLTHESLSTVADVGEIARDHHIAAVMDEAWLFKAEVSDPWQAPNQFTDISRRDYYDFMVPLDQQFLQTMVELVTKAGYSYVAPFWTNEFFA
jgi:hypothetical protein